MKGRQAAVERLNALVLAGPEGEAGQIAAALIQRVEGVSDRAMLAPVLGEFVHECDDAGLLASLSILTEMSRSGHSGARRVTQELAINAELFSSLDYDRVQELYAVASDAELQEVAELFLSNRHQPRNTVDEAEHENEHFMLPLGLRKAAARTTDRNVMDRLMRDTNPMVIGVLLNNPRLRERDVVFIAAKRPTKADVLRAVAAHPRWNPRYAVRKALACNPYTPSGVAMRLMATLMRQDLRFIASTSVLADDVREEARRLLAESRPTPGG